MENTTGFYREGHFRSRILADFPDFDDPELAGVRIPTRFTYTGWKNAACPSFTDEAGGQKLWIDWKDPDNRESERPRFQIDRYAADEDQYEMVFWSDDWEEIEKAMA